MRKRRDVQYNLFGEPIEPKSKTRPGSSTLTFEGRTLRTTQKSGETWWVAGDVCRILGLGNPSLAVNGRADRGESGLDEDEKGVAIVNTLDGGPQEMLCVSESGLYSLIFKSRKPEAKRFRRWVTGEVLPSIRRYGYYRFSEDRVEDECRRLRCDRRTGFVRLKKKAANRDTHRRLRSIKAPVRTEVAIYNGLHRGQFAGRDAAALRGELGIKPHRTPLDHMSGPCLSQNLHAQIMAEKIIADHDIPLKDQPEIYEMVARDIAERDLAMIGPGSQIAVRFDHRRGPILDVVKSLASA